MALHSVIFGIGSPYNYMYIRCTIVTIDNTIHAFYNIIKSEEGHGIINCSASYIHNIYGQGIKTTLMQLQASIAKSIPRPQHSLWVMCLQLPWLLCEDILRLLFRLAVGWTYSSCWADARPLLSQHIVKFLHWILASFRSLGSVRAPRAERAAAASI